MCEPIIVVIVVIVAVIAIVHVITPLKRHKKTPPLIGTRFLLAVPP